MGFARPVEGRRGPSTAYRSSAKLAPSSHFFAICLHFFRTMLRIAFFIVSRWFLNGFWKVWGRFWGCFGGGFSHDFQKIRFSKKIVFSLVKIDKFKGLSYEKSMKKHKNSFKFRVKKRQRTKSRKNMVWDPPGLHFEEFRGALGRRWGILGRLFGVSCTV